MYLIIIFVIGVIFLIVSLKTRIIKKYLLYQFKVGIGLQYREITKEYYNINKNKAIDEETFIDFEMPDILKKLNYTYNDIGNEYLYNRFFEENNDFEIQEAIIKKLSDEKRLTEVIYQLNKLNRNYVPVLSIQENLKKISSKDLIIIPIILILDIISIIMMIVNLDYSFLIIIMVLSSFMINSLLTQKTSKVNLQIGVINDLISIFDKLLKINIFPETSYQQLYLSHKNIKKMMKVTFYFNKVKRVDIFGIFELIKAVFFIEIIQAWLISSHKEQLYQDILVFYENIGLLDTCVTIKVIRSKFDLCIPEVIDQEKIEIKEGYHFLIENPVKNTITLDNNTIITGSNASGKSTFLKMVGANLLLAKALNISFAKEFKYYPFTLISSIHMKDDIISGDSFYVKEIKRLKQITNQAKKQKSLILIDEILKGTNEKERIVIARALLKYLFLTDSMTIASTHDIELSNDFDRIDKYCFNDIKKDSSITFDYQIKKGICTIGNAIAIVNSLNFDQAILEEINKITKA